MAEPKPFTGKVILITGAASGIGQATATYLAVRGATLSLCDISNPRLEAVVKTIQDSSAGTQILTRTVDVCDAKQVEEWVQASKEKFGRIDGCVNSAGVAPRLAPITHFDPDEWNRVLSVNLTGVFYCLKYQLSAIVDGGSIVNLASVAGLYASPNLSAYTASKHGVVGLTKAAAAENAARSIRVNAVCPSWTDTPMAEALFNNIKESVTDWSVERTPQLFHRVPAAEEVAGLIAYLLGDESKFMTKTVYEIGGGYAS